MHFVHHDVDAEEPGAALVGHPDLLHHPARRPVGRHGERQDAFEADSVIGCDGGKSTVRQQYVGDNARVSGHVVYRAVVDEAEFPVDLKENAPVAVLVALATTWFVAGLTTHGAVVSHCATPEALPSGETTEVRFPLASTETRS